MKPGINPKYLRNWAIFVCLTGLIYAGIGLQLTSCAHKPTPLQAYTVALEEFTGWVGTYNAMYKVATPTTQADWKKNIDPIVLQADAALDAWKAALGTDGEVSKYQAFNALKNQTLATLLHYGIVTVED